MYKPSTMNTSRPQPYNLNIYMITNESINTLLFDYITYCFSRLYHQILLWQEESAIYIYNYWWSTWTSNRFLFNTRTLPRFLSDTWRLNIFLLNTWRLDRSLSNSKTSYRFLCITWTWDRFLFDPWTFNIFLFHEH